MLIRVGLQRSTFLGNTCGVMARSALLGVWRDRPRRPHPVNSLIPKHF